jgi:uncharacterized membrane protein
MSTIESSKTMALIGSILLVLTPVPYGIGIVLGIIGIVLLLSAIKGFSSYYRDPAMYDNAVKGIVDYIIAIIAFGIALIGLTLSFTVFLIFIGLPLLIIGLIVAFLFYIRAARHLRTMFNDLAQKTGEHSFETAGYLLWLGAILTIVLIGGIIILIAWIFAFIGFVSMRTTGQPYGQQPYGYTPPPPPPPTASTTQATRYCPNCGALVDRNAAFCPNCGKPLPPA